MGFHIFEETFDYFSSKKPIEFSEYIQNKFFWASDEINNTKHINNDNRDLIYECFCFISFCEYMLYYGKKHTDGPFKFENTLLASSSVNMYDLKKKTSSSEYQKIVNKLFKKVKNGNDHMEVIDIVSSYCKENDLNPLYLLIYYNIHFSSLKNNSLSMKYIENKPTKVYDDYKNIQNTKEHNEKINKLKEDKINSSSWNKIKEHKAYYIYTMILIVWVLLLYLFSPNSFQICVVVGFVVELVSHFIIWQYSINNYDSSKWILKISTVKFLSYAAFGIISLIAWYFNSIIALIVFSVLQIWSFITLIKSE